MTIQHGIAVQDGEDFATAVGAAIAQSQSKLPTASHALVLVTHSYGEAVSELPALMARGWPGLEWAGATVNGLTYRGARYDAGIGEGRAVAVVALASGGAGQLALVHAGGAMSAPHAAADAIADGAVRALGDSPSGHALLFSGGLAGAAGSTDATLITRLHERLPQLSIFGTGHAGGLSVDGQLLPGQVLTAEGSIGAGVLALFLEGVGPMASAAENGLRNGGPLGSVTKMLGPVVAEIDGVAAKGRILDAMGAHHPAARASFAANPMMAQVECGLAMAYEDADGFLWPSVLAGVVGDGIVTLYSRMNEPAVVATLTRADCMEAAGIAARSVRQALGAPPALALGVSCGVRGFVLGETAGQEDHVVRAALGCDDYLGILANGEIATRGGLAQPTAWVYTVLGIG